MNDKIQRIEPLGAFSRMGGQQQDQEINRMRVQMNRVADWINAVISGSGGGSSSPATGGAGIVNTTGAPIVAYSVVGYTLAGAMALAKSGPPATTYVQPCYIVQKLTQPGTNFYPNMGVPLYVRVIGSWSTGGVAWLSVTAGAVAASRPSSANVQISVGIFADSTNASGVALIRPEISLIGEVG